MIGGVRTDAWGRTSIRNLFAAGECAAAGFHGANRLASNSLLECLVFGHRAGTVAGQEATSPVPKIAFRSARRGGRHGELDLEDIRNSLRSVMWRNVGIEREADGLKYAMDSIDFWSNYVLDAEFEEPGGWELQNMLLLGRLMAWAALKRTESRGVHYRNDHPRTDDRRWKAHIVLARDGVKSHQYRMESRTWPTVFAGK
jgi:L-aspartate oxidase